MSRDLEPSTLRTRLAKSLARMRAERERGTRRPRDPRRLHRSAFASRWSDASDSDSDAWRHQACHHPRTRRTPFLKTLSYPT